MRHFATPTYSAAAGDALMIELHIYFIDFYRYTLSLLSKQKRCHSTTIPRRNSAAALDLAAISPPTPP
jgi:hypothetical protein